MTVAIEDIIRAERNHMPAGQHVMNAALHQAADVEVVGVQERRDRDAKHVFRIELFGQGPAEELVGQPRDGRIALICMAIPVAVPVTIQYR